MKKTLMFLMAFFMLAINSTTKAKVYGADFHYLDGSKQKYMIIFNETEILKNLFQPQKKPFQSQITIT
jgi:hypothetical protein